MIPADQRARDRIRDDHATTLIVEAAAGTGKTTALVRRVTSLLAAGALLSEMVLVTFTEKAAGEMKLRLRAAIEEAREDQGSPALDRALTELEAARISTIHGLCADLLRERPVEAGIDPRFEVLAADAQRRLYDRAFSTWFDEALQQPGEGVRRMLQLRDARESLHKAGLRMVEHRDFPAAFSRPALDREATLDATVERLRDLVPFARAGAKPDDYLGRNLSWVANHLDELDAREAATGKRDHDAVETGLRRIARWKSWRHRGYGFFARGHQRSDVIAVRDAVKADLDAALALCDADLAHHLQHDLWPLVDAYEDAKDRTGALDFFDLLARTRQLLGDDPETRRQLQQRFTHVFVDEFQDTDPLQADIVLLLCADDPDVADPRDVRPIPGKLFLVGDPKQSIYRFRRADIAFYTRVKAQLVAAGAAVVTLSTSFRSDPRIQAAINSAFAPRMGIGEQADWVPLAPWRARDETRPAVVALPVPRPYSDWGKVTNYAVDQSLPQAVGAWLEWLLSDSGWMVHEADSDEPVPVAPRHVCLLFRRFQSFRTDITRPYLDALEARHIPHVLVGGRSLFEREEVLAVRTALTAIEWPQDELAVFATLKGPLFAVSDAALLVWRHRLGALDPVRIPDDVPAGLAHVAQALRVLRDLHRQRNHRPLADTVTALLDATRAHAGLALWQGGEQVLANVLRIPELAARFEQSGAVSFRAFVRWLDEEAERGAGSEAPVEEGAAGVRAMTVHNAKGLEFPVVILCDPTCPAVHRQPSRYVDPDAGLWAEALAGLAPLDLETHRDHVLARDAEEADRLLYVAATRARDVLVVPVVGDARLAGWVDPLHPALYPAFKDRQASRAAPGCPDFGDDTVAFRPPRAAGEERIRPGLHRPEAGEHEVVWWDPRQLEQRQLTTPGIRHQHVLSDRDDRGDLFAATEGIRTWESWRRAREDRLTGAARTELVHTVTGLASAESPTIDVPWNETEEHGSDRPGGARFGILVHAVLAEVDFEAQPADITALTDLYGRIHGGNATELAAASRAVTAALAHPLLRRAAASTEVRREVPVTLRTDDGLVEGVADIVFRDADGWTVIDYKTSSEGAESSARQVELLMQAVSAATGQPCEGVLFGI